MPAKVIVRRPSTDESALRSRSARIVDALVEVGTTHILGVPDNTTRFIYELVETHPGIRVVPVCREGEAWAIAGGLWVGGKSPVVVIQNTGFLESGDSLRGTASEMGIPLVALIDYRGFASLEKKGDEVDSAARLFEPTLDAWEVPYAFLEDGKESAAVRAAHEQAQARGGPVAIVIK